MAKYLRNVSKVQINWTKDDLAVIFLQARWQYDKYYRPIFNLYSLIYSPKIKKISHVLRCITSSSVFQSGPDGPLSCMSRNKPDSVELVVIRRQQSSMMSWSYESCIRENRLVFRCVFDPLPVLKVDIYRNFSAVFSLDAAIFGKLRNVRHYAFMSQQWACAERAQSENNQVITFTWDDIYFDRSMKWLNLPPTPATDWNLVLLWPVYSDWDVYMEHFYFVGLLNRL